MLPLFECEWETIHSATSASGPPTVDFFPFSKGFMGLIKQEIVSCLILKPRFFSILMSIYLRPDCCLTVALSLT